MPAPTTRIDRLDWTAIATQLDAEGYAVLPGLLEASAARQLAQELAAAPLLKPTPARDDPLHALGACCTDLAYFAAEPPAPLDGWRAAFYPHLAAIADRWNERLGTAYRHPATLEDYLRRNVQAGQVRAQSCWHRLVAGENLPLHQRNQGEHVFPLQIVALLSEPGTDFTGGACVMTEQRPRMQSRPMVVPLALGDAAIIATAQRPVKGAHGYHRVNLRHAVSRVGAGERIGLELTFHHAP